MGHFLPQSFKQRHICRTYFTCLALVPALWIISLFKMLIFCSSRFFHINCDFKVYCIKILFILDTEFVGAPLNVMPRQGLPIAPPGPRPENRPPQPSHHPVLCQKILTFNFSQAELDIVHYDPKLRWHSSNLGRFRGALSTLPEGSEKHPFLPPLRRGEQDTHSPARSKDTPSPNSSFFSLSLQNLFWCSLTSLWNMEPVFFILKYVFPNCCTQKKPIICRGAMSFAHYWVYICHMVQCVVVSRHSVNICRMNT